MSRPSARMASQTSRSFFPVASEASISGQIHATRPVLVAGSAPGRDRRWSSSDFILLRSGKAGLVGVGRNEPLHIPAQNGFFGQNFQMFLLATVRNSFETACNSRGNSGERQ